jgi:hypothetical protein
VPAALGHKKLESRSLVFDEVAVISWVVELTNAVLVYIHLV